MAENVSVSASSPICPLGKEDKVFFAVDFDALDQLFEEHKYDEVYEKLFQAYNSGEKTNVGLLWRLARVLYMKANEDGIKHSAEKELLYQAHKFADAGHQVDPKDFECVRWAAIVTGALSDRGKLGNKEKIQMGNQFKEYLERGLELEETDHILIHLFGRLNFSVANLSWVERNLATVLYGKPPEGSIDEALEKFMKVEELKSGEWVENLLYLAKALQKKGNTQEMVHYLRVAEKIEPTNVLDEAALQQVKHMLKKHGK